MRDYVDQQLVVTIKKSELNVLFKAIQMVISELQNAPDDWDYPDIEFEIETLAELEARFNKILKEV